MQPILITGATGTLGRSLVRRFQDEGTAVRVLSRGPAPAGTAANAWATADLRDGRGLDAALAGVDTVVHAATSNGKGDVGAARTLLAAARRAGVGHLVYVSIVGIDRVPLPYYRTKLEVERLVEDSGLPWTVLRATQFHDLVAGFANLQRWSPVTAALAGVRFQPIDTRDVAGELARVAVAEPAGLLPDLGGPQVLTSDRITRDFLRAAGRRRPVVSLRLPGKTFTAFRAGGNLAPDRAIGEITYARYLAERFPG